MRSLALVFGEPSAGLLQRNRDAHGLKRDRRESQRLLFQYPYSDEPRRRRARPLKAS